MALASYSDLVSAVRDWLARDSVTLTDARISDMVALAEADIWTRLRVQEMENNAQLVVNAQTVALPTRFLGMRRLFLGGEDNAALTYLAPPAFWARYSGNTSGRPVHFTVEESSVRFGPTPDATYSGRLVYWSRPPGLETALSQLFLRQPDIWLYGTLSHAAPFIGDDARIGVWRAGYETAIARAELSNDRERYNSGPLTIQAG